MMMITATILATGPSMLSRIDWSGASQGIDEPPAWAGTAAIIATTIAVEVSMARRAPCRAARIMSFLLLVGAGQGDMRRWRDRALRSEEHTSELQSLMRISYAVFCLKKTTSDHMR